MDSHTGVAWKYTAKCEIHLIFILVLFLGINSLYSVPQCRSSIDTTLNSNSMVCLLVECPKQISKIDQCRVSNKAVLCIWKSL